MSPNAQLDDFLAKLEGVILRKYKRYIVESGKLLCKAASNQEVGSIGKPVFHINLYMLKEAYKEITQDIRSYINLFEGCASCEHQCVSKLNYYFAVKCAWEYVDIPYLRVPQEIRKELLYSLALRHVNQETLGLVFDTLKKETQ